MASTRSAIARTAVACLAAVSVLLTGYVLAAPPAVALSTGDAAGYHYDTSADAAPPARGTQRAGEAGESGEVSLGLADGFAQVDGSGSLRSLVAPTSAVRCLANSFVPGTEVLMADGTTEPIEDVEVGDWVWAHDPETGERGARQVVDVINGDGQKQLVEIEVLGDTVTATDGHPFWVTNDGAWVDAEDLEVGDRLLLADGTTRSITATGDRSAIQRVHNLTVEGIHTYYVEAADEHVLVHNSGPCSVSEVAANLRARAGVNRVEIETPNGRMTIDLEGRSHFDKPLQTSIDTPHVKFETRHVGPNGHESYTSGPVRPATHDDLRLVERILSERGQ